MLAMLDGLREVCRQLLVLAGLSLFLEVLLPSGSLKKYTQFVMGLLLVAAMLNPLLGLTRGLAPEIKASVLLICSVCWLMTAKRNRLWLRAVI